MARTKAEVREKVKELHQQAEAAPVFSARSELAELEEVQTKGADLGQDADRSG
jgi:hypothetical protein